MISAGGNAGTQGVLFFTASSGNALQVASFLRQVISGVEINAYNDVITDVRNFFTANPTYVFVGFEVMSYQGEIPVAPPNRSYVTATVIFIIP